MIYLKEDFMERAQSAVNHALQLVLSSHGEDFYQIKERRGFIVTPQFLEAVSTDVLHNLYQYERVSGTKLPEALTKADDISGVLKEITRYCLQTSDKITPRFLP